MRNIIEKIRKECDLFLQESSDLPLIKSLKETDSNFRKVKVRTKSISDEFVESVNEAFENEYRNLYGRSVFCNGYHKDADTGEEQVYVFPINGFKYFFNPNVTLLLTQYKKAYETLNSSLDEESAESIFVDMVKYSYNDSNIPLNQALFSKKEIIIYNIPYYYAVKTEKFTDYLDLLELLKS